MNREPTRETTIPLRSLRCRACAYRLLRRIRRIEGVRDARVDALPTAAIVRHDRALDPGRITEMLRAAGANPSAAEIAIPVATPAGAEESARSIERELAAVDGIDGAAVDLVRNEVRVVHTPATIAADAIRKRVAAFGWSPSEPSAEVAADPAQKAGARRALLRAAVATLAAAAVTVLGALTGPGALAPFLHLVPGSDAALRRWIAIGPAAALWATVAVALAAIAWCGADMFRRAAGDLRRMLVTGRVLAALAIATLTVVSIWGAANILLHRPAPPLLFGAAVWSLAVVSWTGALTLARGIRQRNRDASADEHLRNALAAAAWHRSRAEGGSLRHARWWAVAALVAAAVAAGAWLFAGASWSLAALAAAAVLLAAAPASFIAAAARPAREAIADLAKRGVSILGGETLDRIRETGTVATNVRGGICDTRPRIGELLLLQGASVEQLLGAAAAGTPADHPLAALIRERAGAATPAPPDSSMGTVDDLAGRGIDTTTIRDEVARFEAEGKSVLGVASGKRLLGALTIAFEPRDGAADSISWLNDRGLRTALLTRNPAGTAAALSARFGFAAFEGGLRSPFDSPQLAGDREARLRAWVSDQGDALSIGRADVAITFAESPRRIAREDAVVTTGSFGDVRALFETAEATARSTRARTRWLLAYHLLALPVAGGALLPVTGLLPAPFLAALASLLALILAGAGKRNA